MGAGAVNGHSSAHTNQVFPSSTSSRSGVAIDNLAAFTSTNESSSQQSPSMSSQHNMTNKPAVCETCDINFTFFKRKKLCKDCHRFFCSTCLPKPPSSLRQVGRQCGKCGILTSGKFTRQQLNAWRVKDMRCFLDVRNIPTSTCKEKHDLIELLILHFCLDSQASVQQREHERLVEQLADRMRNSSFHSSSLPNQILDEDDDDAMLAEVNLRQRSITLPSNLQDLETNNQDEVRGTSESQGVREPETGEEATEEEDNSTIFLNLDQRERQLREMQEAMVRLQGELSREQQPDSRPGIQRASIGDLKTADDAENLTVKQLKEILVNNFVDYKGCVEKRELVDRVKRLWNETQSNKQRTADVINPGQGESRSTAPDEGQKGHDPENDICKICMDAAIDCILLECGHMVTCTKCGKRLADCPICRQYITRVVHIFRS